MRSRNSAAVALTALLLASCAGRPHQATRSPVQRPAPERPRPRPQPRQPLADTPVKIGPPYQVRGIWYVPAEAHNYDEVGYASWYGPNFHGGATANGERYDMNGVSAAHKTLPLPSYVEVTALDTGRTILVRINDRGPFVGSRIIDLSKGAAAQLGITAQGVARVRVRRVEPSASDRLALRYGQAAPYRANASPTELANMRARLTTQLAGADRPPSLAQPAAPRPTVYHPPLFAAPPTAATPLPAPSNDYVSRRMQDVAAAIADAQADGTIPASGALFVEVMSASDRAQAETIAAAIGGLGTVAITDDGAVLHVRIGPYADSPSAEAVLAQLRARGYGGARLVRAAAPAAPSTIAQPTEPIP